MSISSSKAKYHIKKQQYKDLFFIFFGILLYSIGYTAFILPEKVVMGGVAGISALLYYAFRFPAGASIYILNATMLIIAFKALTDIREQGSKVIPQCGFVASYIRRHPEWQELVAVRERTY